MDVKRILLDIAEASTLYLEAQERRCNGIAKNLSSYSEALALEEVRTRQKLKSALKRLHAAILEHGATEPQS